MEEMKKILLSIAALFAAAAMLSAQNMADATETAKLANESLTSGDYQTALAGFQEALKMAEACGDEGLELVATCKDIIPKTINAIAVDEYQAANYDAAVAKFKEAIEAGKEYGADEEFIAKAKERIPVAYAEKGKALNTAGDFAGAVDAFKKSLELDPANGAVAMRLGMALESAGKGEEAIEAYKTAAANGQEANANTKIAGFYLKRAQASLKEKKFADAVKDALESYNFKENPQAIKLAGLASQNGKNLKDATKYFEQYLGTNPSDANDINRRLAYIYLQNNNKVKAKEYFGKLVDDPKYGKEAKEQLAAIK